MGKLIDEYGLDTALSRVKLYTDNAIRNGSVSYAKEAGYAKLADNINSIKEELHQTNTSIKTYANFLTTIDDILGETIIYNVSPPKDYVEETNDSPITITNGFLNASHSGQIKLDFDFVTGHDYVITFIGPMTSGVSAFYYDEDYTKKSFNGPMGIELTYDGVYIEVVDAAQCNICIIDVTKMFYLTRFSYDWNCISLTTLWPNYDTKVIHTKIENITYDTNTIPINVQLPAGDCIEDGVIKQYSEIINLEELEWFEGSDGKYYSVREFDNLQFWKNDHSASYTCIDSNGNWVNFSRGSSGKLVIDDLSAIQDVQITIRHQTPKIIPLEHRLELHGLSTTFQVESLDLITQFVVRFSFMPEIPIRKVTYLDLVALRDNSQLIPGQQYRITDYATTTAQENTQSAGHQFDIIVTADDEKTLNEEARACIHEGDMYFTEAGANLAAWKIWYCLDNDVERFAWANTSETSEESLLATIKPTSGSASGTYTYGMPISKIVFNGTPYNLEIGVKTMIKSNPAIYITKTDTHTLVAEDTTCYVASTSGISIYGIPQPGKGVIYRMIDEWNNDCPYDFKNIIYMFKQSFMYTQWGNYSKFVRDSSIDIVINGYRYHGYVSDNVPPAWSQGKCWTKEENITVNSQLYNEDGSQISYDGTIYNVNNTIFESYTFNEGALNDFSLEGEFCHENTILAWVGGLNKIIFKNDKTQSSYDCYSNSFGNNCYSNSFGNNCYSNSFSNNCYSNSFGNDCYSNSFSNDCYYNSFGNGYHYNSFGNNCYSNSFGNSCDYNSFGNYCYSNSFSNDCYYNSFGNGCSYNSFGDTCYYNSFGNDCYSNSFGNSCDSNSFGDTCYSNSFGNYCYSNSFGNDCNFNSFRVAAVTAESLKNHCNYNHFDDGCCCNVIWNSDTASSSNILQNVNIHRGVSGTSSNYNFINIDTINSEKEININNHNGHIYVDYGDIIKVTYSELVGLRNNSQFIPGRQYRIIDYNTTTSQENTQSAGHQFDIIVTADDEKTLNEEARACIHEGDTYFTAADANLSAWKLWYCLDNDTERFVWADAENGKGVIYRMIDEWNNDVPYDFKNIQFYHDSLGINVYTFTWIDENSDVMDTSVFGNNGTLTYNDKIYGVYGNVIKPYIEMTRDESNNYLGTKQSLNNITFISDYKYYRSGNKGFYGCFSNTFGNNCYSNTFGNRCFRNTFGNGCHSNVLGNHCHNNSFGNGCYSNTFGNSSESNILGAGCYNNIFGNNCESNTFGSSCHSNVLGDSCTSNTFGSDCYKNTFGKYFVSNTFGNYCSSNSFGNYCSSNSLSNECAFNSFRLNASETETLLDYCAYNHFDDKCSYNVIWNSGKTNYSNQLHNVNINRGVSGTYSKYNFINIDTLNAGYEIKVAKNSTGEIKVYCEADLIV